MGRTLAGVLLGFIAGVLAFASAHELLSQCLFNNGYTSRAPWPMEASPLTNLPQIVTDAGVGGLWGALFALILGNPPKGAMTVRGAILGLFGPGFLGTLIALPLIRGEPVLVNNDVSSIWPVLLLGAVFGAVATWLYGFFTSGCRLP
jgi:hypothetical protein